MRPELYLCTVHLAFAGRSLGGSTTQRLRTKMWDHCSSQICPAGSLKPWQQLALPTFVKVARYLSLSIHCSLQDAAHSRLTKEKAAQKRPDAKFQVDIQVALGESADRLVSTSARTFQAPGRLAKGSRALCFSPADNFAKFQVISLLPTPDGAGAPSSGCVSSFVGPGFNPSAIAA